VIAGLASDVLAAVFIVGAAAKLVDREQSRKSLVAFGVPDRAAGGLLRVLIGSELAFGAAMLLDRSRIVGAVGALTLLLLLTAAVAGNLVRGRTPECHCFGRLSRGRIDASTVARNALLASMAAYVVAGGQELSLFGGLAFVFGGAWLALGPLRSRPGVGADAPDFTLTDEAGDRWTLDRLLAERRPVLLVFSQPSCGACHALLPDLDAWQMRLSSQLTVAVVDPGEAADGRGGYRILTDRGGSVAAAYGVTATPSAVLIERNGRMGSEIARGASEISELVRTRFADDNLPRFPRRTAIARAASGTVVLGAFPFIAAACGSGTSSSSTATPSSRPKELKVGHAYICHQTYALCTGAPCVRSPQNPDVVNCDCVVENGYSVGLTPCAQKAPRGATLYSTFSSARVTSSTRALSCSADVPWANCVDSPCELDPTDSSKARCQCPLVKKGPSFVFGVGCDPVTCEKTILSGANTQTQLGGSEVTAAMKRLGQPLTIPAPCPKK
jgi:thiol-disulfide isomerase/thioredoxin